MGCGASSTKVSPVQEQAAAGRAPNASAAAKAAFSPPVLTKGASEGLAATSSGSSKAPHSAFDHPTAIPHHSPPARIQRDRQPDIGDKIRQGRAELGSAGSIEDGLAAAAQDSKEAVVAETRAKLQAVQQPANKAASEAAADAAQVADTASQKAASAATAGSAATATASGTAGAAVDAAASVAKEGKSVTAVKSSTAAMEFMVRQGSVTPPATVTRGGGRPSQADITSPDKAPAQAGSASGIAATVAAGAGAGAGASSPLRLPAKRVSAEDEGGAKSPPLMSPSLKSPLKPASALGRSPSRLKPLPQHVALKALDGQATGPSMRRHLPLAGLHQANHSLTRQEVDALLARRGVSSPDKPNPMARTRATGAPVSSSAFHSAHRGGVGRGAVSATISLSPQDAGSAESRVGARRRSRLGLSPPVNASQLVQQMNQAQTQARARARSASPGATSDASDSDDDDAQIGTPTPAAAASPNGLPAKRLPAALAAENGLHPAQNVMGTRTSLRRDALESVAKPRQRGTAPRRSRMASMTRADSDEDEPH